MSRIAALFGLKSEPNRVNNRLIDGKMSRYKGKEAITLLQINTTVWTLLFYISVWQ